MSGAAAAAQRALVVVAPATHGALVELGPANPPPAPCCLIRGRRSRQAADTGGETELFLDEKSKGELRDVCVDRFFVFRFSEEKQILRPK